ncbi:hypothetical protein [Burkholderia pseudomallei]|uniref:hypothetical protein n=1 Tax=Burkholderia pseudomallei TaxID=28450 RepID=UPI001AD6F4FE|nr:hypothetical protein [Burkholderia pseudomallei]MBO7750212.1 hypothetical protein [Burkholderia pseudomallei]
MSTAIQYWPVGSSKEERLDLTPVEVAAHLVADWIPSLPSVSAVDLMGWPQYLLKEVGHSHRPYLAIDEQVSACERQWKGVMSWMLGVACARKVLSEEGYQWIAPVSAFYPNQITPVSTLNWHPTYPPSVLKIDRDPASSTNLRPDYIALRSIGGNLEWALAEAKGTSASLSSMACPRPWRDQVRNAIVHAKRPKAGGTNIPISRHIVVATRVNPNAKRKLTRRLQVRAWNSSVPPTPTDSGGAEIEVMAAHLYGLCRNLSLFRNADAIAAASWLRGRAQLRDGDWQRLTSANEAADEELRRRNVRPEGGRAVFSFLMAGERGESPALRITVESHTLELLRAIRKFGVIDHDARYRIEISAGELSDWYAERRVLRSERVSVLREGIVVELT